MSVMRARVKPNGIRVSKPNPIPPLLLRGHCSRQRKQALILSITVGVVFSHTLRLRGSMTADNNLLATGRFRG